MARPMRICTPAGLCHLQGVSHKQHNMSHGSSSFSHSHNPVSTSYPSSFSSSMSWPTHYPTTTYSAIGGVSTGNGTMIMPDTSNMRTTTSLTAVDIFLIVGGVALVALGALVFVFRKKIKRCVNRCVGSCGCCLGRPRNPNNRSVESSASYVDIELNNLTPGTTAGACSCSPRMGGSRAMFRRILPSRSGRNDEPMTCSVCGGRVATPGAAGPHGNDTFAGVRLDATGRRATIGSAAFSTSLAVPAPVIRVGAREGPVSIAGVTPPRPRPGVLPPHSTVLAGSSSDGAVSGVEQPQPDSPLPRWPFLHQEREEHGSDLELLGLGGHPVEVTFVLDDDDSDDQDVVAFGESASGLSQSPSKRAVEPGSAI